MVARRGRGPAVAGCERPPATLAAHGDHDCDARRLRPGPRRPAVRLVGRCHPLLPRPAPGPARRVPGHGAGARPASRRSGCTRCTSSSSTRTVSSWPRSPARSSSARPQMMINENLNVPIAFDLRNVPVERFGSVEVRLYVAREHRRTLPIWVLQSPTPELSAGSTALRGVGNGLGRRRADVAGARADQPVVGGLLEDVRAPADHPARRERRREHLAGQPARSITMPA